VAEIHSSATVNASDKRVFDVIETPENWPRFVPHIEGVSEIHRGDRRVGDSFLLRYKVMGVTFDEKITVAEYHRPRSYKMLVDGRMKGTQDWSFEPVGGRTKVTVDVGYELPGGPIGKALDALVLKGINERTIHRMLQNLRGLVEQAEV
jgi:ribosome-associated toxin RatA of RatAB toxin-antitoxin module